MTTLTLGRVHYTHAQRPTYCGIEFRRDMRTSVNETRVTCLHCLKAYDVEIEANKRRVAAYTENQETT